MGGREGGRESQQGVGREGGREGGSEGIWQRDLAYTIGRTHLGFHLDVPI